MRTAEEILTENEKSLVESMDSPAAVLGYDGKIVYTNKKWNSVKNESRFFGSQLNCENYLEFCEKTVVEGSDTALKCILGINKAISENNSQDISFSDDLSGRKLWFRASIHPVNGNKILIKFVNESDKMETVSALRDTEERYRQQFNRALSGIIIGSPDGKITDANPAACNILGYSKKELVEGGRALVVDDKHPLNAEALRIRNEKSYFDGEKVYKHKTGSELDVRVTSVLYRNQHGELIAINTFRDISDYKEIRQKLDQQELFNQATMNSIPGLFYVVDEQLNYVRWNSAFETELGFTDEIMREITPGDNVHPEDREKFAQEINKGFTEGYGELIARIDTKTRGYRYYKLNGLRHESGDTAYLVGCAVDVTDMMMSEKKLARSNRKLEQLFDNSPIGLVMIDEKGEILRANKGFEKMFGYDKAELNGNNVNRLIAKNRELKDADEMNKTAFGGEIHQREGVRYHKNGSEVDVLINTVPVKENDEVLAAYGIYVDLTEQKQLQNRINNLLQNEKEARESVQSSLNEKEVLLQEVHHRVKNNLALMAGLLDLQMMEETEDEFVQKLKQVHGRIFSIAKIHETLYQEKNVSSILMDEYLSSFINSYIQSHNVNGMKKPFLVQAERIELNLNQAVPMGLMLNELLNVLRANMDDCKEPAIIALQEHNGDVELSLTGECLNICNLMANRDSEKFQFKLIEILLEQVHGKLESISDKRGIRVTFHKLNVKGSSSSFVQNLNL